MIFTAPTTQRPDRTRRGYVLIAVLLVIVVLSLAAYRFMDGMSGEYRAAVRTADAAQARSAAVSGIYYTMSLLSNPDFVYSDLNGDPTGDNPGVFRDIVVRSGANGMGAESRFSIITVAPTGPYAGSVVYGVVDESSKLNINALIAQDPEGEVLYNALIQLEPYGVTPDIADAIVDWVDDNEEPRPEGAESDYYLSLSQPYRAKNAPLNTLEELLLVRGITPEMLFGDDQNRNGEGGEYRGLSDFLTIYGRDVTADAANPFDPLVPTANLKVYINGEDPNAVYDALLESGLDEEICAYILAVKLFGYTRLGPDGLPTRGRNRDQEVVQGSVDDLIAAVEERLETYTSSGRAISYVVDLKDTRINLPGGGGDGPRPVYHSPLNDPQRLAELLPVLMQTISTREAVEAIPRLNVNTCPAELIQGLPGLVPEDVDLILAARESIVPGSLEAITGAWLMTEAGLSREKFRAIEKYITGTSMVYRVQSVGYVENGPVARVEAVIDTNYGAPRIVYFRDLTPLDFPRGFPPDMGMTEQP